MIEGHRHEKVVLVVTSYVIGFTTAFLAFGMNQLYMAKDVLATSTVHNVIKTKVADTGPEKILSVTTDSEGLSAVTSKGTIILSAKKSTLESSVIGSVDVPGYHTAIIDAEVSRDGNFVYFCEQLSEENETCGAYVYALASKILHRVSIDAITYAPAIKDHTSSWSDTNLLNVDAGISADAIKPWLLVSKPIESESTQVFDAAQDKPIDAENSIPVVN